MPTLAHINVSQGGVPKLPIDAADIGPLGLAGDKQADTRHHGGLDRAVCLFSLDLIRTLQAEGHPIAPGSVGENLTIEGLDWPLVAPGARLQFEHGVQLEVTSYTVPCSSIRSSFLNADIKRISHKEHAGSSRVYARVISTGRVQVGESLRLIK